MGVNFQNPELILIIPSVIVCFVVIVCPLCAGRNVVDAFSSYPNSFVFFLMIPKIPSNEKKKFAHFSDCFFVTIPNILQNEKNPLILATFATYTT